MIPTGFICKGSYAVGSACGLCARCTKERERLGIPDGWKGKWPPSDPPNVASGISPPPRAPLEDLIGTLIRLLDPPTGAIAPLGCICPPTAERSCRSPYCPRNPPRPMVAR